MQIPTLGHTQFVILAALLNRPLTVKELHEALDWHKTRETLISLSTRMHKAGLITKADELLRSGKTRRVYVITEDGRRSWQEAADFYLGVIESVRSQAEKPKPPEAAVLSHRDVKPSGKGHRERPATPAEFQKVLAHANLDFARAYRILWTLNASPAVIEKLGRKVTAQEICNLKIADANLTTAEIRIQGHRIGLEADCLKAVREAIGERTQGWLFLSPRGSRWEPATLGSYFRDAARAARLPTDRVKLLGRVHSWKHRKQNNPGRAAK